MPSSLKTARRMGRGVFRVNLNGLAAGVYVPDPAENGPDSGFRHRSERIVRHPGGGFWGPQRGERPNQGSVCWLTRKNPMSASGRHRVGIWSERSGRFRRVKGEDGVRQAQRLETVLAFSSDCFCILVDRPHYVLCSRKRCHKHARLRGQPRTNRHTLAHPVGCLDRVLTAREQRPVCGPSCHTPSLPVSLP